MFTNLPIKLRKKSRKYPIKRDEYGKSARRLAFDAFDRGLKPAQVTDELDISYRTAYRYFADWKKQPRNLELRYQMAREIYKHEPQFEQEVIKTLATNLDLPEEKIVERLQKPWALMQLVRGKWSPEIEERRIAKSLARLDSALQFLNLYEILGVSPERIKTELDKLEQEARSHKQT